MPTHADRAAVLAAVAAVAARHPSRTVFIGIDGFGGAGKTTLAAALAAADPRVAVVHVDDFSGPRMREWDWDRLRAQVLLPLLDGRPARYQVWDWDRDEGGPWCGVPVGAVVVVEGVSATRAEVGGPWDLTIWVETPRELRLARARDRDGEAMLPRWLEDWMPSEQAWAAREQPQLRVDLVVSGAVVSGARPVPGLGESETP